VTAAERPLRDHDRRHLATEDVSMKWLSGLLALLLMSLALEGAAAAEQGDPAPPVVKPMLKLDGATTTTLSPALIRRQRAMLRGTQGAYTTRPIVVAGTFLSYDDATSSVLVAIDRQRSSLPNILRRRAQNASLEQELLDRELPPQRAYRISRRTLFLDGRASAKKPESPASEGRVADDPQRIDFDQFKPGDPVSLLYRMTNDPDEMPTLINLSLVDPGQTDFRADFSPSAGKPVYRLIPFNQNDPTTSTATPDSP